MKAILRINTGLTTKTINIPDHCKNEFKVPFHKKERLPFVSQAQDYMTPESTHQKCMIFRWDGKSFWGDKNVKSPIFILDLVDFY